MKRRGWGMMWLIRNPKQTLKDAIREASEHFHKKHEVWPNLITCNPVQLAEAHIQSDRIRPDAMVPASHIHLWGVPK